MRKPRRLRLRGQGPSLRVWFGAFAFIFCSAIVALFALDALHERMVAVGVARRAAENLAASLAQQASDTLEGADGALRALVMLRGNGDISPGERRRLHDTMTALMRTLPRIHDLLIADANGRLVVSNFSATGIGWPPVTDRPYFAYHRSHRGSILHLSGPARAKNDQTWVFFATRRLDRAGGSFAGVAVAPISLKYFEQSYHSVDVGRSGTVTLLADDATIMFRKPRSFIGRKLSDCGVFAEPYRSQPAGWYIRSSPVDGVRRLFAFRRLGRYPLIVQVALGEKEYLADWGSSTRSSGIAVAIVVLLFCGLATVLGAQIGKRKQAEETLARLALFDGLTGLANRRHFDAVLEREWRNAARDQSPLALLLIDVDNFKSYNDLYGHQLGDKALIAIAQTIAANILRPTDLAARYGGEEFVVILPETDPVKAVIVAERIRNAVAALQLEHAAASGNGVATVSIGVSAIVPPHAGEGSALVDSADGALYEAKRTGRNRTSLRYSAPSARVDAGAAAAEPSGD
jgi:diguanylate cyclase (GGDEF)-like protein